MKFKKYIALFVVIILLISNLNACSNEKEKNKELDEGNIGLEDEYNHKENEETFDKEENEINKIDVITDKQIKEQLNYIDSVLSVGKPIEEICDSFDDLYCNYMVNKESFEGMGECYVYIYNNYDTVLKFSENDSYYNQDSYLLGIVSEVNNDFIIINEELKVTDYNIYFDLQLFINNMLMSRKAGIKLDIFTNTNNEVYEAKLTYVQGDNNNINMISYNPDGSVNEYYNILDEIYKYLY